MGLTFSRDSSQFGIWVHCTWRIQTRTQGCRNALSSTFLCSMQSSHHTQSLCPDILLPSRNFRLCACCRRSRFHLLRFTFRWTHRTPSESLHVAYRHRPPHHYIPCRYTRGAIFYHLCCAALSELVPRTTFSCLRPFSLLAVRVQHTAFTAAALSPS